MGEMSGFFPILGLFCIVYWAGASKLEVTEVQHEVAYLGTNRWMGWAEKGWEGPGSRDAWWQGLQAVRTTSTVRVLCLPWQLCLLRNRVKKYNGVTIVKLLNY